MALQMAQRCRAWLEQAFQNDRVGRAHEPVPVSAHCANQALHSRLLVGHEVSAHRCPVAAFGNDCHRACHWCWQNRHRHVKSTGKDSCAARHYRGDCACPLPAEQARALHSVTAQSQNQGAGEQNKARKSQKGEEGHWSWAYQAVVAV